MAESRIKKAGLKVTSPRLLILRLLQTTSNKHLSAEEIFTTLKEQNTGLPLGTIYRVLQQFEAHQLVMSHRFDAQRTVFELADQAHHDHIMCQQCEAIEEFYCDTIEQGQENIATKLGYKLTSHHMILYGLCSACQAKST